MKKSATRLLTQEEIFRALLAGEKIRLARWLPNEYARLENGTVVDETNTRFLSEFNEEDPWYIYDEPVQTKELVYLKTEVFQHKEGYIQFVAEHSEAAAKTKSNHDFTSLGCFDFIKQTTP